MFERFLRQMRERILASQYVVTFHARKEMIDDDLTTDDIERTILTGQLVGRQRDRVTAEFKYLVRGMATDDRMVEVVAKMGATAVYAS